MATSGMNRTKFDETGIAGVRTAFYAYIAYGLIESDPINNRSRWNVVTRVDNDARSTASWTLTRPNYTLHRGSTLMASGAVPEGTFDFRDGAALHNIRVMETGWLTHDDNGLLQVTLKLDVGHVGPFGEAEVSVSISHDQHRIATPPAAPTASAITPSSARVDWNAADGNGSPILEYQLGIWTGFSGGVYSGEISVPKTGTNRYYTFNDLGRNKDHYVRVRARTGAGWSAWSNHVLFKTLTGVPSAPGALSSSASTSYSIAVNWGAATPDSGDSILEYEVQRALNSSFTSSVATISTASRSANFTGLTRLTLYYFRVRARTAGGWGPWRSGFSLRTQGEVPDAPRTPSLAIQASDSLRFAFTAPADNGGLSLKGYEYQLSLSSSFSSIAASAVIGENSVTLPSLAEGTRHYARVRAVNSVGAGAWSSTASVLSWLSPTAPRDPRVTSSADGKQATLSWTAPADSGGNTIQGYQLQVSTSSTFSGTEVIFDSASPYTRTDLTPGSRYYFRVRAVTDEGSGPWSAALNFTQPGPPDPPQLSSVAVVNGNVARVIFTAPSSNGGSPILGYSILRSNSSSMSSPTAVEVAAAGVHDVSGLTPGQTYYWAARAFNAAGESKNSNVRSLLQDQVPGVPTSFLAVPASDGKSVALSWRAPTGPFSAPKSYTVVRYSATGAEQARYTATGTTLPVSGLTAGASYQWAILATNVAGSSSLSAKVTARQPSPNVQIGDYFDGSFPPSAGDTYAWDSAPHESASTVRHAAPNGWTGVTRPSGATRGAGVLYSTDSTSPFGAGAVALAIHASALTPGVGVWAGTGSLATHIPEEADMVASMYVLVPKDTRMAMHMEFYREDGGSLGGHVGTAVEVPAGEWVRVMASFISPAEAARATVGLFDVDGDGWQAQDSGETVYFGAAMVTLGSEPFDYFDGSFTDTEEYDYAWEGTVDASESRRDELEPSGEGQEDPLRDPDCQPAPKPPRPPSVDPSCVTAVDRWRRYWIKIPSSAVTLSTQTLPILTLETGPLSVNQVRIRFWEDPNNLGAPGMEPGGFVSEQVVSFVPKQTSLILDSMTGRAYAEVAGKSAIAADHLVYGTGGTPPTWPVMDCGIGYMIALDVPSSLPVGAVVMKVELARRVR